MLTKGHKVQGQDQGGKAKVKAAGCKAKNFSLKAKA